MDNWQFLDAGTTSFEDDQVWEVSAVVSSLDETGAAVAYLTTLMHEDCASDGVVLASESAFVFAHGDGFAVCVKGFA